MSVGEIVLCVNDGSMFKDGDVLQAMNRDTTRWTHAQCVAHIDTAGFTRDGLRPMGSAARWLDQASHKYMFRRVGRDTIERTDLLTADVSIVEKSPGEVDLWITRRKQHPRHRIYGLDKREFWFGRRRSLDTDEITALWSKLTELTGREETDSEFELFPFGREDIKNTLIVKTQDFTFEEQVALMRPQYEMNDNGEYVWRRKHASGEEVAHGATPPDDAGDSGWYRKPVAARNIRVDWVDDVLPDVAETEVRVRDCTVPVGRELLFDNRIGFRSKTQPIQTNRERLKSRELGNKPLL